MGMTSTPRYTILSVCMRGKKEDGAGVAVIVQSLSRVQLFCNHMDVAARLLCPWDSPGKNTGGGCHLLLQGIFPTQGWNGSFLHCRQILYR